MKRAHANFLRQWYAAFDEELEELASWKWWSYIYIFVLLAANIAQLVIINLLLWWKP